MIKVIAREAARNVARLRAIYDYLDSGLDYDKFMCRASKFLEVKLWPKLVYYIMCL